MINSNSRNETARVDYLAWVLGGVDTSLAGHGGEGCYSFRSNQRKVLESAYVILSCTLLILWASKKIWREQKEQSRDFGPYNKITSTKQLVLVATVLMFGIQVGYKFATMSLIYLLQPCHLATATQIYLLAAPVNTYTQIVYRIHAGFLNGGVLAILFPVLDTFFLPFEVEMYYIQHYAMLLIPVFLASQGGPFTLEPFTQVEYSLVSYCAFMLYHIMLLQPIAMATGVNISTMLCPLYSDPFYGENYLLHATWHQLVVIFVVIKLQSASHHLLNKTKNKRS